MPCIPLLQFSLDFISIPTALVMALRVGDQADIIEIGTPLCKAAGMNAVRAVREVFPSKLILADMKTPDVGDLEAQLAFDAGADMITVMGGAPLATLAAAQRIALQNHKEVLVELTGVRHIFESANDWQRLGVKRVVYHRGWDEGLSDRVWADSDLAILVKLIEMGFEVSIAGGITVGLLPFFKQLPVSIIIAGRAIHQAGDPPTAASEMRTAIHHLWS